MALLVYDDIVLTGNDGELCTKFEAYLNICFRIKDLGPLNYYLGIELARSPKGCFYASGSMHLILLKNVHFLEPSLLSSLWR